MVVGGLPERSDDHAECVANQALDMMHYCEQVIRPDTGEPLQVGKTCQFGLSRITILFASLL